MLSKFDIHTLLKAMFKIANINEELE